MSKRLSYCLFSGMADLESTEKVTMSGLFCWAQAFSIHGKKGDKSSNTTRDLLEEYDLIHVNYTPGNASYISGIRDALGDHSSTKIISQVDFSVGLWSSIDPLVMRDQLSKADFVFHVEPVGARILTDYLGYDVPSIPHPADTLRIAKLRKQPSLPAIITCQYHRYMYTWTPYYYATTSLRKKYGVRPVLMNVSEPRTGVPLDSLFDEVMPRSPYDAYLSMLSDGFANIDVTADYTYGRGIVDAASLGVPTIGSVSCDAANRVFPELVVNPYDHIAIRNHLEDLITNPEFASHVASRGMQLCKFYSLEDSYNRLIGTLEERDVI